MSTNSIIIDGIAYVRADSIVPQDDSSLIAANVRYNQLHELVKRFVDEALEDDPLIAENYESLSDYVDEWQEHDIEVSPVHDYSVDATVTFTLSLTVKAKSDDAADDIARDYIRHTVSDSLSLSSDDLVEADDWNYDDLSIGNIDRA